MNSLMQQKLSFRRRLLNGIFRSLMRASAFLTGALALSVIAYILAKGLPVLDASFLFGKTSYLYDTIGIGPQILNTVVLLVTCLAILIPLGIGTAIYLNEYCSNRRIRNWIEKAADILAGTPSILFGLVGMMFFCQKLSMKTSLGAGALTMVILALPSMIKTSQESLRTIPASLKEGAYGLGAGKWQVIRTVCLPGCLPGLASGIVLCSGRILGESAALLFTAGCAQSFAGVFQSLASPGATLSVGLYLFAKEQGNFEAAFGSAAVLLVLALIVSLLSGLLGRKR